MKINTTGKIISIMGLSLGLIGGILENNYPMGLIAGSIFGIYLIWKLEETTISY